MKGVTKEGIVGWENDSTRYDHTEEQRQAIDAYRLLRRADRMPEANAVRAFANRAVMLEFKIQETERVAREGKAAQPWEDFIRPFAVMDAAQLKEWIETFKMAVVEEKQRQARDRVAKQARGS